MHRQRGTWIPEGLNQHGYQSIDDVLVRLAERHQDKPVFSCFGQQLSYRQLDEYASAFAVYLQRETSLEPGDRIAIQLPNLLQYPVVLFGAIRAGLVVVNTNPLYTPREMEHQFNDAGVKALIIYKGVAHTADEIIANTSIETVLVTSVADLHSFPKRQLINGVVKYVKKMIPDYKLPGAIELRSVLMRYLGEQPKPVSVESSDLAVLQYTGGTTGVAKGAMLSHANLLSNMLQGKALITRSELPWAECVISPLPLYHIYAFTLSLVVMECGGNSVLITNPRDIPGFIKELGKWRVSAFIGLNTLFVALCNRDEFKALDFSNMQLTISGGMALTHDAADQWQEVTGCQIMEGYGLTEASPAVAINPPNDIEVGTIGYPLDETEFSVRGSNGELLPDGEAGDLCVRGPQVMKGYWQRPEETDKVMTSDGFLITGDIAVKEDSGRYRIVDRAKDLIIVSGFNVYPNEIEDIATLHPKVLESAAVGVADQRTGEAVKLFVVKADDSLEPQELIDWCRERLTSYKVPKQIAFSEDLPKTNVGKVLRRELRDR